MHIYFVRHGESVGNVHNVHQNHTSPLTREGRRQAHIAAARFAHIPIDAAFSSDFLRASETAKAIAHVIHPRIRYTPLLREMHGPRELEGLHYGSKRAKEIRDALRVHRSERDWHFSDEENFYDLQARAIEFIDLLGKQKKKHILVVTHGLMLRMIVGTMLFQELFSPDLFSAMFMTMRTRNTGITMVEHTRWGWKLNVWNDHAHLG